MAIVFDDENPKSSGRIVFDDEAESTRSIAGFGKNLLMDAASNVQGAVSMASQIEPTMAILQGENPFSPKRPIALAKGLYEGVKQLPRHLYDTATNFKKSAYERPISTALDVAPFVSGGISGANALRPAVRGLAKKTLPGVFKATAGIPEKATEIAIDKPSVFNKAPVSDDVLNQVVGGPVIEAIQTAKKNIGDRFGKIYRRFANMEGPMQEIIDTPNAQGLNRIETSVPTAQKINPVESREVGTGLIKKQFQPGEIINEKKVSYKPGELHTVPRKSHSYEDLLINKNLVKQAFVDNDSSALNRLYRSYVGTPKSDLNLLTMKPQDKLQILTRIKREIQRETDFNKAPITLKPIDGAKDAALKSMASEIDSIRTKSKLPGADVLAGADDAWKSLNEIYDTIQRDLSDPGKARDTLMRLMKGDNTWATSGKFKAKSNKIREVELLTGQKILEPAMEELTRQVFKDWAGKGFVSQVLRGAGAGGALFQMGAQNPLAAVGAFLSTGATSPRVLRGGLKASAAVGGRLKALAPNSNKELAANLSLILARKRNNEK